MGAGEGLPFAKSKQLNPCDIPDLSRMERDSRAKLVCVALYEAFIYETGLNPFDFKINPSEQISTAFLMSLDWDHIKKRSTNPELIYDFTNWQLLDRVRNTDKQNGADMRSAEFKKWIEARDFK